MTCVLSEELAPTPLEAVQVMMAKALSLITLVRLRLLVTLNNGMVSFVELEMIIMTPSSAKRVPFMNQEMVGAGTPVAVHISTPGAPSETVAVGFWESKMAASGATTVHRYSKKGRRCKLNRFNGEGIGRIGVVSTVLTKH